jgi:hypothetical protein
MSASPVLPSTQGSATACNTLAHYLPFMVTTPLNPVSKAVDLAVYFQREMQQAHGI